jgi:serine phosphatase RsbU (regulator of sigma subunit)/catechol 2,3-dioxygenase-like lactoylglutathione lyase family enzyme
MSRGKSFQLIVFRCQFLSWVDRCRSRLGKLPASRCHEPKPLLSWRSIITAVAGVSLDRDTVAAGVRLDAGDPYLRLHAVNIYVRDLDRSLHFYVDQLGFHLALDRRLQSGQRLLAVAPPDGTGFLRLIAPDPDSEACKLIGRPTHIAFLTEDVIAKYGEWSKRGVRFRYTPRLRRIKYDEAREGASSEAAPVWGGVFTSFRDPDGNTFTLVGLDEVSREIEAERRAIAERVEAERRAAQELEIARQVQARLFPQTLPGCGTLEYAGVCMQARQVGGDYYDFLELGQDRLGLIIGDIAGKGIAAALLMANLQANLRSQCATALAGPQRFLESVNQRFYENTDASAYATLFFGEYDDRERRLRYANCGHLPGLLVRSDRAVERLHSTATVLGLFADWSCSIGECVLIPGDTLVLYTDGVTEAFNEREEEFGEQRLIEGLGRSRGLRPEAVVRAVLQDLREFSPHEQRDDITLIVAKCRG